MTPTEAPQVNDLKLEGLNTNLQDNLNKITEGVNTPEKADQISKILTTCFQEDLQKLYATKQGKDFVTALNQEIITAIPKTTNQDDLQALNDLGKFISPFIITLTETTTTYQNGFSLEATNTGSQLDYNTKLEGANKYLPLSRQELKKNDYKDLPGKDKLLGFLTNPTKENIQKLQEFLYSRLTNPEEKIAFEKANKIKGTNEKNEKKRDGAFGTNTNDTFINYLKIYLKDFTAFKPTTTSNKDQVDIAIANANRVAEQGDKLNEVSTPKKSSEELQEEQKDKNVVNLQKEVGTKNGEDLVESENFKLLPDKLQRKIQRVLKIETKDENVEKEISDIDLKIANKTEEMNKLTKENEKNQITIDELTRKINLEIYSGADFRKDRQERKNERKQLQKKVDQNDNMIEGLTGIDGLKGEISDLNYEKTFLVDKSDRLDNRFENKIVRINKVLASDKKILKDKITKYENDTNVKKTVDKRRSELAAINAFEDDLLALQQKDEEINIASNVPKEKSNPVIANANIDNSTNFLNIEGMVPQAK